jgi:hypothetical protein
MFEIPACDLGNGWVGGNYLVLDIIRSFLKAYQTRFVRTVIDCEVVKVRPLESVMVKVTV